MTSEPRYLEFDPDRPDEVVATMEAMGETHKGWVNFEPAMIDVDDVPPSGSGGFTLFSARGPAVPLGTWTPAPAKKRQTELAMLGLQHAAGSKARPVLAERGHPVPVEWTVVQDHARKGLVVALPAAVGPAEALRWLLRAANLLSTVPLTGAWRAAVYSG